MINGKVIAAVRNNTDLITALNSNVKTIFVLSTNLDLVEKQVKATHSYRKKLFVHIEFADGIAKDEYGVKHLKDLGVDGIISTKSGLIKAAKKLGLFCIQRFFIVDSRSIDTTVESVTSSKPDVIELMPGIIGKAIKKVKSLINVPVVAGGIIDNESEIELALSNGAVAVSVSKQELW